MKTIALKNGTVIFVEQIAFIHVQPSAAKEGITTPEIHIHYSATFSLPTGSRSMRTVIADHGCEDFMDQLEKHGVDCAHMRRRVSELLKPSSPVGQHSITQNIATLNDITKNCFDTLLTATAAGNFEQFISVGGGKFKELKPEVFHLVSQKLAPRMRQGFASTFLGELRQNSYLTFLWRLRFDDKGDDLLFRMGMADGKVIGALVAPTFN